MLIVLVAMLAAITGGLFAFMPRPPHVPDDVSTRAELDAFLERLVSSFDPPGISVVVVERGEIVYRRAFGIADGPSGMRATPDTVYHWWSMTKIVTAIAVLQLQEDGMLHLDDPVAQYLPWFEVGNPEASGEPIRIKHLLRHTSGLPDTMPAMIGWVHYEDVLCDQTEIVRSKLPEFNKQRFPPGERGSYSNLNYMLLGAVIESITGQPYEEYIEANILDPLGMERTGFIVSESMALDEAAGTLPLIHYYTPLLPLFLDPDELIRERRGKLLWLKRVYIDATPSTGLIGPASDTARLMLALLNDGELNDVAILGHESMELLNESDPIDGHGIGWFVGTDAAGRYLEHPGGGPGFATIMRIYPAQQMGIVILANGTDLDRRGITEQMSKLDW